MGKVRVAFALVDDKDFELLNRHRWGFSTKRYAKRGERRNGVYRNIYLHHEIIRPPTGLQVDHINQDKLDNQRKNLRICTNAENCRNRRSGMKNRRSVFYGIYPQSTQPHNWQVRVGKDYRHYHCGTFYDEHIAALAHDLWALDLHGEYAHTNFTPVLYGP